MATFLVAAGSVMQAMSMIAEGQRMAAQAEAEARAQEVNAMIAEMQAKQVETSAEYERKKLEREKRRMLGRQRALYAKAGVLSFEGSPLEVMADTATQYEMDIAANQYNASILARRYRYEASYRRNLSSYYSQLAPSYRIGGFIRGGATLLTSDLFKSRPTVKKEND